MRIMTAFTPNGFIALHSHAVLRLPPLLGYTQPVCVCPPCAAAEVAQGVAADDSIETPDDPARCLCAFYKAQRDGEKCQACGVFSVTLAVRAMCQLKKKLGGEDVE